MTNESKTKQDQLAARRILDDETRSALDVLDHKMWTPECDEVLTGVRRPFRKTP